MNKTTKNSAAFLYALLAAALYAISSPISKILLDFLPSAMTAAFLYLGAGIGVLGIRLFQKKALNQTEKRLAKNELPYIIGMVILDIAAPILLMIGLKKLGAAEVSLLNNFEIAATSLIASLVFKEKISIRLWLAIILITCACIFLSIEDVNSFTFTWSSLFVLLACVCWGLENNCTKKLSYKNPLQIVAIKGLFSGLGALITAFIIGERINNNFIYILAALLLGFVAYGLSIVFYIYAQRKLGAAKTSACYAVSPFFGSLISFVFFPKLPQWTFFTAFIIMITGTILLITDNKESDIPQIKKPLN